MALAAISGILSTTILGGIILAIVVFVLRSMWKKKKAGGACGCSCGWGGWGGMKNGGGAAGVGVPACHTKTIDDIK